MRYTFNLGLFYNKFFVDVKKNSSSDQILWVKPNKGEKLLDLSDQHKWIASSNKAKETNWVEVEIHDETIWMGSELQRTLQNKN